MTDRPPKITVSLPDREFYRAIRHAAVEKDKTLREIVIEALEEWLDRQEELEDLAAIAQAEGEETVPWEQVKAEMHQAREANRAG